MLLYLFDSRIANGLGQYLCGLKNIFPRLAMAGITARPSPGFLPGSGRVGQAGPGYGQCGPRNLFHGMYCKYVVPQLFC